MKVNTPEYWDFIYSIEKKIRKRYDPIRWDLILSNINPAKNKPWDIYFGKTKEINLLDFGCGLGAFLEYVSKKSKFNLYGIDISDVAIDTIKEEQPNVKISNDIKNFKEIKFGVITIQHVIEHINEPLKLIAEITEYLSENGLLILVIPVRDNPWHEHPRIWLLNDIINLLNEFAEEYQIIYRNPVIVPANEEGKFVVVSYDDGRPWEEAIIFIKNEHIKN